MAPRIAYASLIGPSFHMLVGPVCLLQSLAESEGPKRCDRIVFFTYSLRTVLTEPDT